MELVIRTLHDNPEYMDECADILNEEWRRSKAARLHSLQKSSERFPICLLLLKNESGKEQLIGHSKLSIVHGKEKSCLIESVCVRKCLRGKGYGRGIMDKSEQFAVNRGYTAMYLTTHDKQEFYKHLGYTFCGPVISFGADPSLVPEHLIQQLTAATLNPIKKEQESAEDETNNASGESENKGPPTHSSSIPPPPQAPPPPPPPAPPPPPPPPTGAKNKPEIVKWDPRHISWMKKSLN